MLAVVNTADPTLAMVREPECEGAGGKLLSPSANRTRFNGSPSASAATCVIDVYVPGPISLVPHSTSAVPSALILATAAHSLRAV
jgi:hypothetical protein